MVCITEKVDMVNLLIRFGISQLNDVVLIKRLRFVQLTKNAFHKKIAINALQQNATNYYSNTKNSPYTRMYKKP